MITVILSGGSGSRLWPVSRESYPKQFCEFFDQSFLNNTIERLRPFGTPYIVTLQTMGALTHNAMTQSGIATDRLLLEPLPKNTAAAIALVVHHALQQNLGDEVLGVFPADHLITDVGTFQKAISLGEEIAKNNNVVTLGIQPRYPATGYGYLEVGSQAISTSKTTMPAYPVKKFCEKPNIETAEKFLEAKNHYWNAGIFFFKANHIAKLFEIHMPELWKRIKTIKPDLSNLKSVYSNLMSQSLDYGIMEKLTDGVVCIPGDFGWSDVGSWDELARLQEEKLEISSSANVFSFDAADNFVYSSHDKVIGVSGVDQLIIVDTPDALLVTRRGESQNVKKLVEMMREARLPQADGHSFEVRPWGRFEILSDQANHKVKRLIVEPGRQLSYQEHQKRDEHWTFISGNAEVVLDDKTIAFKPGEQIYIPRGSKHRLRNPGKVPVVIIEVQTGQYFGEDDIKRFQDDYDRV
ncbi:MAG: mannose-1-phosphate guanylyltransferase/mannose-6-phosphate isomerase [Bdellovibrionales bacterium]|nr:mannose-1-phosphate guanylyltransferase/mannose-6-phosphate isomerase [Bdellovibrionales bacterium]